MDVNGDIEMALIGDRFSHGENLAPPGGNLGMRCNAGKYPDLVTRAGWPIDDILNKQLKINQTESELCDLLSIPAGARIYRWSLNVKRTWWYKFFSRFHKEL